MDRYSILRGLDLPKEYIFTEEVLKSVAAELERQKIQRLKTNLDAHLIAGVRRSGKSTFLIQDAREIYKQRGGPLLICTVNQNMSHYLRSALKIENGVRWCTGRTLFNPDIMLNRYSACYFDEASMYNMSLLSLFNFIQHRIHTERTVMAVELSDFAAFVLSQTQKIQFVGPWSKEDLALGMRLKNFDGRTFFYQHHPWQLHVLSERYR